MKLESRGCGCGPLPYLGIVPGFNRLGGFPDQLAVFIFYPVQIVNILRAGTPVRDGSVGQRHFLQGGRLRAHENFGAVNGIYFRAARFPHGLADAEIRQLLDERGRAHLHPHAQGCGDFGGGQAAVGGNHAFITVFGVFRPPFPQDSFRTADARQAVVDGIVQNAGDRAFSRVKGCSVQEREDGGAGGAGSVPDGVILALGVIPASVVGQDGA